MSGELRALSVDQVVRVVHHATAVLDMTPVAPPPDDDIEIN